MLVRRVEDLLHLFRSLHLLRLILSLFILIGAVCMANGQYLTNNVLDRVKKIGVSGSTGTVFTMEVDGSQYLITAKHVITALKGDNGEVEIFEGKGKSKKLKVKILRCPEPVDIAVLVPEIPITPTPPLSGVDGQMIMSQDMFFVGFPYGDDTLSTLMEETAIGFARKAMYSAQQVGDGWVLMYLDGTNNPGFSGGPVVYQDMTLPEHPWKIAAVISGFRPDLSDVYSIEIIKAEQASDEEKAQARIVTFADGRTGRLRPTGNVIRYNTGIVQAYGIQAAVKLIRAGNVKGPKVQ